MTSVYILTTDDRRPTSHFGTFRVATSLQDCNLIHFVWFCAWCSGSADGMTWVHCSINALALVAVFSSLNVPAAGWERYVYVKPWFNALILQRSVVYHTLYSFGHAWVHPCMELSTRYTTPDTTVEITPHTVVWECCKDDQQSQWGMPNFGVC